MQKNGKLTAVRIKALLIAEARLAKTKAAEEKAK